MYEAGSAISSSGALTAFSGAKTGRSPSDKRIVKEPSSENEIWWGPVNKPMAPEVSRLQLRLILSRNLPSSPFGRLLLPPLGRTARSLARRTTVPLHRDVTVAI